MNILVVTPKLSKRGGIERYTFEIFSRLSEKHNIVILVQESDIEIPGIKIIIKNKVKGPFWFSSLGNHLLNYFTVRKIKKDNKIDVVFSNGGCLFLTDVAVAHSFHFAGMISRLMFEKNENYSFKSVFFAMLSFLRPKNIIINIFEFLIFKFNAKKIIPVSIGVGEELKKYLKIKEEKIEVIANGVDLVKFKKNLIDRDAIRLELGVKNDELLIIFSGHEFKRKGLRFIIEALSLASFKKLKLLVLGRDNPDPYILLAKELGVYDRIIFLGEISNGIEKYYSASDLFVFPTIYEAFSLATLEAAASGLPLLVSRVNGTEELVKDGINGFFIQRTGKSIAEKIDFIVSNNLIFEIGNNSQQIAKDYSWDNVADKTEEEIIKVFNMKKTSKGKKSVLATLLSIIIVRLKFIFSSNFLKGGLYSFFLLFSPSISLKSYTQFFSFTSSFARKSKKIDIKKNGGDWIIKAGGLTFDVPKYVTADFIEIAYPFLDYRDKRAESILNSPIFFEGSYLTKNCSLNIGDYVFDFGANLGFFSLFASKKVGDNGRVYSFEPISEAMAVLKNNVAQNNASNIVLVPNAVGDKIKEIDFDADTGGSYGKSSSIMISENDSNIIKVKQITLDSFIESNNIERVDFLKADIEGSERYMLKGAEQTIKRFKPKIAIKTYHLPDDPEVIESILRSYVPEYIIEKFADKTLYAHI